jgi:tetratricopeptide (TPR) repeat protein
VNPPSNHRAFRRPRVLPGIAALLAAAMLPASAYSQTPAAAPPPEGTSKAGAPPSGETRTGPPGVEDLIKRGNQARRDGRVREAIAAYRRARDLAPHTYEIRLLLADTLRRTGDAARALPEYETALTLNPSRYEAYAGKAQILRARFDHEAAATLLTEALGRVAPESRPDILLVLAETRRRQKRFDEAGRLLDEILEARPGDAPALGIRARLAEDRGDLPAAIAAWDGYLKAKPDDEPADARRRELRELKAAIAALRETASGRGSAPVLRELGRLQSVAGDAASAAESFRRALRVDPEDAEARLGLAQALRASGLPGAARAWREFGRLLNSRPGDAVALFNLAALAFAQDDAAGEGSAWQTLVAARPDDLAAVRGLVSFLERQGPEALARAAAAVPVPTDGVDGAPAGVLRGRALLLAAAGRWDGAADALYRALRRDPTDPWTLEVATDILFLHPQIMATLGDKLRADLAGGAGSVEERLLLARLHWWSGRGDEALIILRQAVTAFPASAMARSALGEAYQEVGRNPGMAIEELARAVELDPARVAAHVDLVLAILRTGRPKPAEAAARRALSLFPQSAPILSVLGAALAEQGDFQAAADEYALAVAADPADNFGLARGQLPLALAAAGRHLEARRALRGAIPPLPDILYREAWSFARDSFRDKAYNGQDWLAWRTRYRGALRSEEDACRAIATMLGALGDPYTRLRDPEETAALFLTPRGSSSATDPLGRAALQSRTVATGELPGGLGYIRLGNFTDPGMVADVRAALERMRRMEGIVLDLRGNSGGLGRSADAIGDLFVGPGKEAGVDVGPLGETTQVTGGDGALTESPLVVLVDGQTGSAAERLARTLETTGRATLSGEATFGKGKAQMSRVLPGGATVLVSSSEMLGPDRRPIQGKGLQPGQGVERPAPTPQSP